MYAQTVARVRELEKLSLAGGMPEYELMRRAGVTAAAWIDALFPDAGRFIVLAGGGNNGGDALVVAAHLTSAPVEVFAVKPLAEYSGCAVEAAAGLPGSIPLTVKESLERGDLRPGDVIIDGLLGIGFAGGKLRDNIRRSIEVVNRSRLPVVALDLPSGIDGDSGLPAESGAVEADITLTFGAVKAGLLTPAGSRYRGQLRLLDIGLLPDGDGEAMVFTNIDAVETMPQSALDCHKNSRGRVMIWGGSPEYPGAAALAAYAALKSGAGIVRCASQADLSCRLKDSVIFHQLFTGEIPEKFMADSDVLVCGCGWGSCAVPESLRRALVFPGVVILDADALNCAARHPQEWIERDNLIITPHPGEAERLRVAAGLPPEKERGRLAARLAAHYGAVTVLKGRDTVVASPSGKVITVAAGSELLATAGSGDVLSGVIGALAAQRGMRPFDAAVSGVYIHGIAGENFRRILSADDLPELISQTIRKIRYNRFI